MRHRKTLTVMPFLLAMFAAVAAMPTNVYQICAWNAGTLEIEPWRKRSGGSLLRVTESIRAWLAALWTPRLAHASLAVLLAAMLASQGAGGDGILLAIGALSVEQQAQRAALIREAEALRGADGRFADDAARQLFDQKMAAVEAIDAADRGQSVYVADRNPLDPGAPTGPARGAAQPPAQPPAQPNDRDRGALQERERVEGINFAVRAARLPNDVSDALIREGISLVEAQARIFRELNDREVAAGANNGPRPGAGPRVEMGIDTMTHLRAGIENAILHRVAPSLFKLEEIGRPYRGMSLLDVGKTYLQAQGVRVTGMGKMDLAGAALGIKQLSARGAGYHTTSDFPFLLADIVSKTTRRAYEEAPQTFKMIGRRVDLPDFRPVYRTQLGDAPQLLKVEEHGEFTRGTIGEGRETYQLATYGRVFAITRKALVNDDTDSFGRIATLFGRAARTLESNLAWEQLTSNPTMGDSVALFHADHNNLTTPGTEISVTSIGAIRTAMRMQESIDGELLNIAPKFLIVPPSLETLAEQFVAQVTAVSTVADINPFSGKLTVITDPRLEADPLAWYIAASPDQIDMLEYGTLEGEDGPMIESRVGFDVDGLEVKARHDFAAKVIDYRGFHKNEGAAPAT